MVSKFTKTGLISTSMAPVFLAVFVAAFSKHLTEAYKETGKVIKAQKMEFATKETLYEFLNQVFSLSNNFVISLVSIAFAVILGLAGWLALKRAKKTTPKESKKRYKSLDPADGDVTGFLISLLIPIMIFQTNNVNLITVFSYSLLFFALSWNTNSYKANPLLGFLGYKIYKITSTTNTTYTLLSKHKVTDATMVTSVRKITDFLLINETKPDSLFTTTIKSGDIQNESVEQK